MKQNRVKPFKPCGNRVKSNKKLPVSKSQKMDNLIKKCFILSN